MQNSFWRFKMTIENNEVEEKETEIKLEHGVQPIDAWMVRFDLKNQDIVAISEEQISHKSVSKARKGRRLTKKLQQKIHRAFNSLNSQEQYRDVKFSFEELFNYKG